MKVVFWLSTTIILYVYLGYPILLGILSRFFPKHVNKGAFEPFISIIITAYNEEKTISKKIKNTLELDYPKEKMEIIVASDASSDRTDEIIKSFQAQGVILIRKEPRKGKTAAQNYAVSKARGEIVFFSDATTHYDKNVLRKIVENFADPEVGCVGGLLKYVRSGNDFLSGGRLYWNYETWVKKRESLLGTLIGVSGCLYAVRREIYNPLPEDLISDFLIAIEINRMGYRTVLEPEAISKEFIEDRTGTEFQMRVRVALRSMRALLRSKWALNILVYPKLAWQLWSHKVIRYLIPLFMISLLLSSYLTNGTIYTMILWAQLGFYLLAIIGYVTSNKPVSSRIINLPFYFCLANLASLKAFLELLAGKKYVTWETIRR